MNSILFINKNQEMITSFLATKLKHTEAERESFIQNNFTILKKDCLKPWIKNQSLVL